MISLKLFFLIFGEFRAEIVNSHNPYFCSTDSLFHNPFECFVWGPSLHKKVRKFLEEVFSF